MPIKHTPPEWIAYFFNLVFIGLAGAFGAFIRQVGGPEKGWIQRCFEWAAGALFAIYATPVVSPIMHRLLERNDLAPPTLTPDNITGLAGFLSGAFGITMIELIIRWAKKRAGLK